MGPRRQPAESPASICRTTRRVNRATAGEYEVSVTIAPDTSVNLEVYTVAALHKRQDAVEMLESALARRGSP